MENIFDFDENSSGVEFRLKINTTTSFSGHLNKDGTGENTDVIYSVFGRMIDKLGLLDE